MSKRTVPALLAKVGAFLRRLIGRPAPIKPPETSRQPRPGDGAFIDATFTNETGSRDYKLYVPAGVADRPRPLVVMLHGCTQSPDDFAAGTGMNTLADEFGLCVVYPAQSPKANPQKCWNWFSPGDQQRGQGEPALIAGIAQEVGLGHRIDPGRVYVAGLSAGGAMAAVLGETYPDRFAAIGVHSGLPYGAARNVPSAFTAMRGGAAPVRPRSTASHPPAPHPPTIVFHGDQDKTVHPHNADHVVTQALAGAEGLTTTVETAQAAGGHAYTRTLHTDAEGRVLCEQWVVHGSGHAWSGGSPDGSYTDPLGPDAARAMLRFFLEHRLVPAEALS